MLSQAESLRKAPLSAETSDLVEVTELNIVTHHSK